MWNKTPIIDRNGYFRNKREERRWRKKRKQIYFYTFFNKIGVRGPRKYN